MHVAWKLQKHTIDIAVGRVDSSMNWVIYLPLLTVAFVSAEDDLCVHATAAILLDEV